jgi:transporter family protein
LYSLLIFVPFIIFSYATDYLDGTLFYLPSVSLEAHGKVFLKSLIVLSSWIAGYFSVKHLPLTLNGQIKATHGNVVYLLQK